MTMPLIELQRVGFDYHDRRVLHELDFRLEPGERVALIGANGAGKTTLLHLLVGLKRPSSGRILAFGRERTHERDFHEVRTRVGLLFQDSDDQLFCPTVLEDVAFGPLNLGRSPEQARTDALETLDHLGLADFAERITYRLSAGEKRLVALATVLAMHPEVLLLDEPTTGLDEATAERLIAHLEGLKQAMILVSHDWAFLARLATRAVRLVAGRLVEAILHSHTHAHRHDHLHPHSADELIGPHTDLEYQHPH
ncbi:ATP-binding cassette domain-containing protein [Thermochromatium tepidum ATCC 43061]|uniref:ATP-binding cassette domain-containing protein n=2 Tax=Thermochromatium tepidum TaxID=1050 RepID=A0A6I6E715_THETI|nr:ABC transporter ATP-binding protein [Thermochromatium tepidum]QGU32308.1 ATP-binding cassette domain-containing protein [Thermochromatium tepidum ATCC 43061]